MADPEKAEERRKAELVAAFLLLLKTASGSVRSLAKKYVAGKLTPSEFGAEMERVLVAQHTQAVILGRSLAGIVHAQTAADLITAERAMNRQALFLSRFVDDLEAGRYALPGEVAAGTGATQSLPAIAARAELYAHALYGTANKAWVDVLPGTELIRWHLGGTENNCSDCPSIAAASPYPARSLPFTPGSGQTQCKSRCRCYLSSSGFGTAFTLPPSDSEAE